MSDSVHVICPACDAINRVPRDRLTARPTCGQCRAALFQGAPLELDAAGFERHLARCDLPLLVDFWAPWCGPCRMMAPAFAAAAAHLEPDVRLIKVNTEEAPQLGARLGIRSIPTLMLLSGGAEIARQAGALDTRGILDWTRRLLAIGPTAYQ